MPSVSDVEQQVKFASLVTRSPEAGQKFLDLCEVMAADLLRTYGHVLIALATVLKLARTLTAKEIDNVIATAHAGFTAAMRRREWQRRIENAARFEEMNRG